jgi:dihydroorotate dehydrogenase
MDYYSVLGKAARLLSPETAHHAALFALKHRLVPPSKPSQHSSLRSQFLGIAFSNPVGLAAGFDKDAEAIDALFAQGFGFLELGTVTPLPQPGNPRPRLFRLSEDEAIINRFGFNSKGVYAFADNLKKRKKPGIIGANISKNRDSLDVIYDYSVALATVYDLVDYIVINISSPNTVGLRDLQQKHALSELMLHIEKKRVQLALAAKKRKPLLYKIAPDLSQQDKEDIVEVALANNIDGLIIANTTVARPVSLKSIHANERGGLSGKPIFDASTAVLRDVYRLSGGRIPLIGVGGIASAEDAYAKIKAGASLVQLYSSLIYRGFGVIRSINEGLVKLLERDGFSHIQEAIGKE